MTLTRADMIGAIANGIGLTQYEAHEMVDAFFEEIAACLTVGQEVNLYGFGVFRTRNKALRPGRNPRTGEMVPVTARRVVTFHPSRLLRDGIDGSSHEDGSDFSSV